MFKGLKGVLGFLTIISMPMPDDMAEVAKATWLFPVVGALLGLLAASFGYAMDRLLPWDVAIILALLFLYFLTGFHHLDGLLDFGDGLMCRGTHGKRLEAMADVNTGSGGFGVGFFVLIITFLALREFPLPFLALVAGEVAAKMAMVSALYIGRPAHPGMGSTFSQSMRGNHLGFIAALAMASFLGYFFLDIWGVRAVLAGLVVALVMEVSSRRLFGGISGDVLGAINEIARMTAFVVMLI